MGRDGRPVHLRGQGDHEQAPAQARRPAGHRDRGPGRIPDLRVPMPEPAKPAPTARWLRLPRRTVRLKLTVLYGALFLVCGIALLAVTYFLVEQHLPTTLTSKNLSSGGQTAVSGNQFSEVCYTQAEGAGFGAAAGGPASSPDGCAALLGEVRNDELRQLITDSGI